MPVVTFETAAVKTASGNSAGSPELVPAGNADGWFGPQNLSVQVTTASVGGTTPSLTVEVQWSQDGTTFSSNSTPDTFTAITANGSVVKTFPVRGRFARLAYTITGTTPSFTVTTTALAN